MPPPLPPPPHMHAPALLSAMKPREKFAKASVSTTPLLLFTWQHTSQGVAGSRVTGSRVTGPMVTRFRVQGDRVTGSRVQGGLELGGQI